MPRQTNLNSWLCLGPSYGVKINKSGLISESINKAFMAKDFT